ncbi:phage tail spike protein [Paenibacillus odorifer]|uniref:phage tail spike protein n=1 Tax=Paenibacillus odorifer TaxID=189426 RepID=UPI00096BD135|nr:phage tail spike protein [Paenibacillus odorifer]
MRLGDIDFKRNPVTPQLFLCKPNKQSVSKMGEAFSVTFSQKLGALNELNFTLPVFVEKHHGMIRNKNADMIKGRYLIKFVLGTHTEFFVITNLSKIGKDSGETIEIKALSLGFEMNDKIIRNYTAVSKTATELLNDLLVDTIWKVGYVDSEFDLKYRGLEVSSGTVLEQVFEVAKTFNALVVWDTLKRTMSLVKPDLVGQDKGFKIKYGKYLESFNQEDNAEEIITRLKMYGKEDISIREINPTGTTFIEDFNYFVYPYQESRNYINQIYSSSEMKQLWTHNASDWSETNGALSLIVNSNDRTLITNPFALSSKNYKLSGSLKAIGDDDVMGIVVRYQDENNYYFIGWESGLINGGLGWGSEHLRIYKVKNGVVTLIAKTSVISGWSINVSYTMTVEVYNENIKVWIDNRLVINAKDSTFETGSYGFFGQSQQFGISNVKFFSKEHEVLGHSDYMSDELCHTIIEYDSLLQENKEKFSELVGKRETFNSILNVKNNELKALQTQCKILLDERDVLNTRIAKMNDDIAHTDNGYQDTTLLESDLASLLAELNAKLIEIKAKEFEVSSKEAEIVVQEAFKLDILNQINLLKILLDVSNNFTSELLSERNQYIIEKEWQDNNIEDPKDLLAEGIKAFNEFKEQKITLKVDLANFLSMITEQKNWDKLGLGDTINIEHERLQVLFKAKLTEVEFDFDDASINVTISNIKDLYANKDKFLDMLYKSYSTSTQVSIDKWKWDLSMENKGSINQIINNFWDANKQAIIGAKDQVIEISDRGLIIRDPNNPLTYLVGLNGMLAITNDGGETWKHAITGTGIVGERIYGKIFMGVNLALEDEDGVLKFQGSKGEIFDRNGKLVMKLGLVDEEPDTFGLWSFNDITRVKVDQLEGFVIDKATTDKVNHPDGWEKVMWADPKDGTLYTKGLVAQNIKIVNNIGETILDSENNYLDIGDFNTIVMDNKLTSLEKMQIITELYKINSGYHRMLEQAEEYKRSQRDDIFDMDAQFFSKTPSTIDLYSTHPLSDAYFSLMTYISQYIEVVSPDPLNINVNSPMTDQTSEIPDRAEFILKFKTYYDEEMNLRNKIEDAQFYSGLNMGQYYNNVVIGQYGFIALRSDGKYRSVLNATNGLALQKWENNKWTNKVYGSIGNSSYEDGTLIAEDLVAKRLRIETKLGGVLLDADALNFDFSVLDSIILDDVIVSTEKITLSNQYKSITKQYITLKEQINRYATTIYNDRDSSYYELDTARTQLVSAGDELDSTYSDLTSYMNPVFANMNATTHIVNDMQSTRLIFHTKWENFYKAYEGGRAKLADFLEKSSLQLGRNYNNTVIDAENGVVVTRGNMKNKTTLNATYGIKIERNDGSAQSPSWYKTFYVDVDGNLFAEDMSTRRLRILDAELGDAIIFDWQDGITIKGKRGEVIRLNANEGIDIKVNGEKRFWVHNDGTLRARKLIIEPDVDGEVILDEETNGYISDLMVNSLKTVMKNNGSQDYIYIRNNFIKMNTGTSSKSDITKFLLHLTSDGVGGVTYPEMIWGQGNGVGGNIGYIRKLPNAMQFQYTNDAGNLRALELNAAQGGAVKMYAVGGEVVVESDSKVTITCGSSSITLTPSGIKISGSRIDFN